MVTDQPQVKPASRYSIGQTCTVLGIHRNTLLNHTKKGHITCHYRKATGQKFYTGQEITKFWYMSM